MIFFLYDCKRNVYFALNETPYWGLIFVIFCQKTLNLVWKLEIMSIGVGSIFSWFKLHLSSSDHNLDRKNKNWFFTFLNFQFRNYFVSQNIVTQIEFISFCFDAINESTNMVFFVFIKERFVFCMNQHRNNF